MQDESEHCKCKLLLVAKINEGVNINKQENKI